MVNIVDQSSGQCVMCRPASEIYGNGAVSVRIYRIRLYNT